VAVDRPGRHRHEPGDGPPAVDFGACGNGRGAGLVGAGPARERQA